MAHFNYSARDESGQLVSGAIEADSIDDANRKLRTDGMYPTSIRPGQAPVNSAAPVVERAVKGIKVTRTEVIQFSTQLAIMIETGVTLSEALECIALQSSSPRMKAMVEDLSQQVQNGTDFSAALSKHPRSFPRVYTALIRASERSGMMSKLLHRATAYLRDEQETVRKVRGALTYPGIMLGFAVTTTIFLLAFVMPRFTTIYANKGAALPTPTKVLMAASAFVTGHYVMLIIGVATAAAVAFAYFSTRQGKRVWHFIQLHTPLLGPMFLKLHLSRGIRMVGTMAGSGVTLVDCVQTAQDLCPNTYFQDLWKEVSHQIHAGRQISEPLSKSPLVPKSISHMIHSGEKSGKLAQVLEQIAAFSEQELKEKIAELTRYIEPAMIVLMGAIIGGVALALMLPIFSISKVVAH